MRENLLDTESMRDGAGWGRLFIFQGEKEKSYRFQLLQKIIIKKPTKNQTADILQVKKRLAVAARMDFLDTNLVKPILFFPGHDKSHYG